MDPNKPRFGQHPSRAQQGNAQQHATQDDGRDRSPMRFGGNAGGGNNGDTQQFGRGRGGFGNGFRGGFNNNDQAGQQQFGGRGGGGFRGRGGNNFSSGSGGFGGGNRQSFGDNAGSGNGNSSFGGSQYQGGGGFNGGGRGRGFGGGRGGGFGGGGFGDGGNGGGFRGGRGGGFGGRGGGGRGGGFAGGQGSAIASGPLVDICDQPTSGDRKKGSMGNPIKVLSNYIPVNQMSGQGTYCQYQVDFDPSVDSERLRQGLLGSLRDEHLGRFLFRGNMLFSRENFLEPGSLQREFTVFMRPRQPRPPQGPAGNPNEVIPNEDIPAGGQPGKPEVGEGEPSSPPAPPNPDEEVQAEGLLEEAVPVIEEQQPAPYHDELEAAVGEDIKPQPDGNLNAAAVGQQQFPEGTPVRIIIRKVGDVSVDEGGRKGLQVNDILVKRCLRALGLKNINRTFYDMSEKAIKVAGDGLVVAPAYLTAIHQHDGGLLMNCMVKYRAMPSSSVLQMIYAIMYSPQGMGDRCALVKQQLLGSVVRMLYNDRTYRIGDIDFHKNPTMPYKDNNPETFVEYYQRKHPDVRIEDLGQPLLVAMPTAKDRRRDGPGVVLHLLPELCYLTGISDDMRSNRILMENLAKFTRMRPDGRVKSCQDFIFRMHTPEVNRIAEQEWNMRFGESLVDVTARQIGEMCIAMGPKKLSIDSRFQEWGRALRDIKLERPTNLENWAVVYSARDAPVAQQHFVRIALRVGPPLGMVVRDPMMVPAQSGSPAEFIRVIKETVSMVGNGQLDAVVIIVPDDAPDRYAGIKKELMVRCGIPSQVIVSKTLHDEKKRMSVVTKVMAQIVCKRGGALWSAPASPKMVGTLILGYDIFKDKESTRLVGALVASLDPGLTKYYSRADIAENPLQLSQMLVQTTWVAIKAYYQAHKKYPARIIFFRSGISEGQTDFISSEEVEKLENFIKEKTGKRGIPTCFMVVNRRCNTQFYLPMHGGSGFDNPPPGTIVDSVVTSPDKDTCDFFLVPQSARQGTVSPVYFKVLKNTIVEPGFGADFLQALSYKLCHMYYNWPGTIRVPAIIQYATKYATMIGTHLHALPDGRLVVLPVKCWPAVRALMLTIECP